MRDFIGRILTAVGILSLLGFGECITEKLVIGICAICVSIGSGLMVVDD